MSVFYVPDMAVKLAFPATGRNVAAGRYCEKVPYKMRVTTTYRDEQARRYPIRWG